MSPLTGFILGVVQGLTEFLPVSSSGHLVLAEHFLKTDAGLAFEIFLHLATLLAAVWTLKPELTRILAFLSSGIGFRWVAFRSDDLREGKRLFVALVVGTLPAAAAGLLFKRTIEAYFEQVDFVGFSLILTGVVLFLTYLAPKRSGQLDAGAALTMGFAQALALLPGVSRSGMTVSAGLFAGVRREKAVRFSFLMSVPAILGASLLEMRHGLSLADVPPLTLVVSFLAAFISGAVAMQFLLRVVILGRLGWFGAYCILVGGAVVLFKVGA